VLVFIDDILVDSANCHGHKENLETVLEVLGEKKLLAKLSMCAFWLESGIMHGSCRLQGCHPRR
jgi:hypothetical protein